MRNVHNLTDKPLSLPHLVNGDTLQPGEIAPLKTDGVSDKVIIGLAMAGKIAIYTA